ncbi:hypothetical protein EV182_006443 [Spiromyces aspiralis]|uniref:Uncharacterized protein n=1 Tax=Spiromyces aspiralis TaxID=68401 RepID=A0ACC1HPP6_9FUNG|nr:hypothetical protein EV182_006443 [Spiromyces aspiralis]
MAPETTTLSSGYKIPTIGLGTYDSMTGEITRVVHEALKAGYRHIDCARLYGNEDVIGEILGKQQIVPRNELFITSKVFEDSHRPDLARQSCLDSIRDLQVGYLDLLLIHWPHSVKPGKGQERLTPEILDNVPIMDTWRELEKLVDEGLVKSIGVSNFNVKILEKMLPQCRIKPAVNQVELNPCLPQHELVKYCHDHDIAVVAYCPLGKGKGDVLTDPTIKRIVERRNQKGGGEDKVTEAQVALAWNIQRGVIVIPKTANPARLEENFKRITLTPEEMAEINAIKTRIRYIDPAKECANLKWVFSPKEAECPVI